MMEELKVQKQSVPGLFGEAWKIWREGRRQIWWIVLAIVLPVALLAMVGRTLDQPAYSDLVWLALLLQYGSNLILVIAWMAVVLLAAERLAGAEPESRDLMRESGERYFPGVLAFLTAVIARKAGLASIMLFAEIVPQGSTMHALVIFLGISLLSIIPLVWVSFFPFLTIVEERPLARGFRMSVRIVHRRWLEVAGVLVMLFLLSGTVSLLIWAGLAYLDHVLIAFSLKSGLSYYSTIALDAAVTLPLHTLDQVVFLFLLTVFTVYFVNRRAIWPADNEDEADESEADAFQVESATQTAAKPGEAERSPETREGLDAPVSRDDADVESGNERKEAGEP